MARHPDWFERLDAILDVVSSADIDWLGRNEVRAIFRCSERDSVRLLHRFGAEQRNNALTLARESLLAQLEAIRSGTTYAAYLRQRHGVARHLSAARAESEARHFRIMPAPVAGFATLPPTVRWRRTSREGPGRFEVQYTDGADLMRQLADFLAAAGANREEFFAATESNDDSA